MQKTFVTVVQQKFQFLIEEFNFVLLTAKESPRGDQWEGDVQYMTKSTYIDINCTRGEFPSLWIGRTKDKDNHVLPLQVIYEYMILSDEEKRIVLSIPEAHQASLILQKNQLINLVPQSNSVEERRELQLDVYARCLRQYALPMLRGDFSNWLKIWEYHIEKLTVENTRAGRPEFIPIVITDSNGQFKITGKQPVFKKALDYIQELKDEQNPYP